MVEVIQRPDAPYNLTDREVEIWRAIVNRLPADWFPRETQDVLVQYVRHVCTAERVAQLIHQAEGQKGPFDIDAYAKLLRMQEAESRAIASLATRMRITQQSLRSAKAQKPIEGPKPWEFTGYEA